LASSAIQAVVTKRYPLAQAAEAWKEQMKGHARGKIVLEVGA
jgi:NADPH:quinone reductase-like Zn-dependent oxidoreductase